jgi:hypothetical protein
VKKGYEGERRRELSMVTVTFRGEFEEGGGEARINLKSMRRGEGGKKPDKQTSKKSKAPSVRQVAVRVRLG